MFHAVDQPAAANSAPHQRRDDDRRRAGDDVEVAPRVAHLRGHDAALGQFVHRELERQAKRLNADEYPQGNELRETQAERAPRDRRGQHEDRQRPARQRAAASAPSCEGRPFARRSHVTAIQARAAAAVAAAARSEASRDAPLRRHATATPQVSAPTSNRGRTIKAAMAVSYINVPDFRARFVAAMAMAVVAFFAMPSPARAQASCDPLPAPIGAIRRRDAVGGRASAVDPRRSAARRHDSVIGRSLRTAAKRWCCARRE